MKNIENGNFFTYLIYLQPTQLIRNCLKATVETSEQVARYVQR